MNAVGLDLSLTSTGVAMATGTALIQLKQKGEERLVRVRDLVLQYVYGQGPDLREELWHDGANVVAIEGYAFGAGGHAHAGAHGIGELGGVVRVALYEHEIPFVVVAPATLKKYATGKGNAKKDVVLVQAARRADLDFGTSDEADAWWLRAMAMDHYGEPLVSMPQDHREALNKVPWPEVLERVR